ncbi:MAG: hypothetical protein ACXWAV_09390, partial [Chthoniobacterales bacterium]
WESNELRRSVLICFATLLIAAAPNEQKEIQDLYRRGLAGDKEAVRQCIDKLEAALAAEPKNQLARVYLGSAYTLRSRDLGFSPRKLQALRHGLALMDEAVAAAPNESKIRLVRALTTSSLPGFLGQGAASRKDFEQLAQIAEATPEKFEPGDLAIVFYHAGFVAKANGDRTRAAKRWREGLHHSTDPSLTAKLNAELSKLQ